MIVSAIVTVGPLGSLSYQYNSRLVLENLVRYFDKVYVISSSRLTVKLPVSCPKIVFISDDTSWVDVDSEDNEIVCIDKLCKNAQRMWELSYENGDDFLVHMCINQYIDEKNAEKMRRYCEWIIQINRPFGYIYKAYQIIDQITFPDSRLPWVINLKHHEFRDIRGYADSIYYKGAKILSKQAFYAKAPYFIIDIFGEMTERDFHARYDYYLKYVGNAAQKGDDWNYWRRYYEIKIQQKLINREIVLSEWGRRVLANIPPDALAYQIKTARFNDFRVVFNKIRTLGRKYE